MANRPYNATYEPRPGDGAAEQARRLQRFYGELDRAGLGARAHAERAASSVLCALEQRLTAGELRDLHQDLPWELRELLRRCERHPGEPPDRFGRDELVATVAGDLGLEPLDAERTIRVVLGAARLVLSPKQASDVTQQLPEDIQDLWIPAA